MKGKAPRALSDVDSTDRICTMKKCPLKSNDPCKHVLLSLLPNAKKMRLFTNFIQIVKLIQVRLGSGAEVRSCTIEQAINLKVLISNLIRRH